MQLDTGEGALAGKAQELQTQCPIEHGTWSKQKTARLAEPVDSPIECDAEGVWHVRGFAQARAILRSKHTQQAGFNADMIGNVPGMRNQPILYQEGKTHDLQRKTDGSFLYPQDGQYQVPPLDDGAVVRSVDRRPATKETPRPQPAHHEALHACDLRSGWPEE